MSGQLILSCGGKSTLYILILLTQLMSYSRNVFDKKHCSAEPALGNINLGPSDAEKMKEQARARRAAKEAAAADTLATTAV